MCRGRSPRARTRIPEQRIARYWAEIDRDQSGAVSRARFMTGGGYRLLASGQTLEGSFSAVSTATIATKYSFFQDFRDLQDFHTFAPLRSQNFSKKVVTILSFLNKLNNLFNSNFMKNAWKLVFFFEILMKFCRNFTNIFRKCQNLRRIAENSEKIAKIWSKSRNRWDYSIVEMNYSVVSLIDSRVVAFASLKAN